MTRDSGLPARFRSHLGSLGLLSGGTHFLVAVSGGCDSISLLHLLRFSIGSDHMALSVAHLDHGMRPDSAADALWVAGVCRAWGLPIVGERTRAALRSEDDARRERYRFLRRAAREVGATHILTAHHADDQAETVLFRILRGAGIEGIAGIPATTPSGIVRPLLPFWRAEIEEYARASRLRWRSDPSNQTLAPVRNRIRHDLLPLAERTVAPAARRNLVRLAEIARESEAGWTQVLRSVEPAVMRLEGDALVLARGELRAYHPALASRLVRSTLRRFGVVPTRAGTRAVLQFITDATSGREMRLRSGVRIATEFDTARVERVSVPLPDRFLAIDTVENGASGGGDLRIGGRAYRVAWEVEPQGGGEVDEGARVWRASLLRKELHAPLLLRSWVPGDRIRLRGGSRRLKKLFGDRRIPRGERSRRPVLVDAEGAVLWIAGVEQAVSTLPHPDADVLSITIIHD